MEMLTRLFKNNIRQYGMIIALVVIMLLFEVLTGGCCSSRSTLRI